MTDKDLLQEAKAWRSDLLLTLVTDDLNENLQDHTRKYKNILNDLIEQAEQVQELESEVLVYKLENRTLGKECEELRKREQELEKLVVAYQTELSIKDNANKRIKKQNKRYREAYENAKYKYISLAPYGAEMQRDGMLQEINKALEDESNE